MGRCKFPTYPLCIYLLNSTKPQNLVWREFSSAVSVLLSFCSCGNLSCISECLCTTQTRISLANILLLNIENVHSTRCTYLPSIQFQLFLLYIFRKFSFSISVSCHDILFLLKKKKGPKNTYLLFPLLMNRYVFFFINIYFSFFF